MALGAATSTLTPLIGRTRELASVVDALARSRLVSITGLGGTGKTRLAQAVVEAMAADIATWFVDLAEIGSVADVPGAVARATGVAESAAEDLPTAVARTLARGPSLVVLDNFEHVLGAGTFVTALLEATPSLRIVVTSRVRLELEGELALPLAALSVPASPADVEIADASRLFLRRARSRGAGPDLDPDDAAAIVQICRLLDGLPLALELAAAWTPVLGPRAIARRLEVGRLELAAPASTRHASLEHVVDATLELVTPEDRTAFGAMGVFAGGFDDEAAEAVTGIAPVLHTLRRLEGVSVITSTPTADGEPRFVMLETIRSVARRRLEGRGGREATERRFAEHFAARAQQAADGLRDLAPAPSLAWFSREIANVQAAYAVAVGLGDAALAVQLAMTMATYGVRSGSVRESLTRLRTAMELGDVPPGIRSEALSAVVNLRFMLGSTDGLAALAEEAVVLAEVAGHGRRRARAMVALGSYGPASEAARVLEEATDFADRIDYPWAAMAAAENLASVYADQGRLADALARLQRVAQVARKVGDADGAAHALMGTADLLLQLGRIDEGLDQAIRATSSIRSAWPESPTLVTGLAILAGGQALAGDQATSYATLAEAATVATAVEADVARADVLEWSIPVLALEHPVLAARAHGSLDAVDDGALRTSRAVVSGAFGRIRTALGVRRVERERRLGGQMDPAALLAEVAGVAAAAAARKTRLAAQYGRFTDREMEVLDILALGGSDQEIAERLAISPKTASVHVGNIKAKLGVGSRLEAAIRARDLVTVPRPSRPGVAG